ncbi:metal ABC transporter permease [Algicella marina]|uniref:Iron chelate uptake ABC transporter family permease subunit n=1 Tax=Algicella marina TaxID=2683284 RepID=A0A6P1T217_9RHOB|nr:iron chelate uptake ABC transporter family permease subunit [Algicella marina]QHQ36778.1 iron chelate uptake ABC transporter family permease subunit [Algicella marina]
MEALPAFLSALTLQAGYNATLVAIGAGLLGIAAGSVGAFLFLRKRALVSDAVAHATLPGVGLAFIAMVALGGDGRNLAGLLAGSAVSAGLGLLAVEWITARTRLAEDAAIGAVLSVFFGFGVVLLTIIQTMTSGRQAGLESFLLGSTAGMLYADALIIAVGGALAVAAVLTLRRPLTLVAFDAGYAETLGLSARRMDLGLMLLVMAVVVIGLKIVGLILIVAMLIIPAVTARFWTERAEIVVALAAMLGGISAYVGAALSAAAPAVPTGPVIVLVAAFMFTLSLLFAPGRGVLAALWRRQRFQRRVHLRQGLLALAREERILEPLTLRVLRRAGLIRADGVATDAGRARAARTLRDEARWDMALLQFNDEMVAGRYDGLTPIEEVLTGDEIAEIDRRLARPGVVA